MRAAQAPNRATAASKPKASAERGKSHRSVAVVHGMFVVQCVTRNVTAAASRPKRIAITMMTLTTATAVAKFSQRSGLVRVHPAGRDEGEKERRGDGDQPHSLQQALQSRNGEDAPHRLNVDWKARSDEKSPRT